MARKHNEIARLLEKNALTAQQISGLVGAGAGGLGGYLSADDKASFGDRAFRTLGGAALGGGAGYGLGHFIPQRQAAQAAQAAGHAAPAAQVAQKAEQAAVQRAGQIHAPAEAPAARASAPATGTAATALAPAAATPAAAAPAAAAPAPAAAQRAEQAVAGTAAEALAPAAAAAAEPTPLDRSDPLVGVLNFMGNREEAQRRIAARATARESAGAQFFDARRPLTLPSQRGGTGVTIPGPATDVNLLSFGPAPTFPIPSAMPPAARAAAPATGPAAATLAPSGPARPSRRNLMAQQEALAPSPFTEGEALFQQMRAPATVPVPAATALAPSGPARPSRRNLLAQQEALAPAPFSEGAQLFEQMRMTPEERDLTAQLDRIRQGGVSAAPGAQTRLRPNSPMRPEELRNAMIPIPLSEAEMRSTPGAEAMERIKARAAERSGISPAPPGGRSEFFMPRTESGAAAIRPSQIGERIPEQLSAADILPVTEAERLAATPGAAAMERIKAQAAAKRGIPPAPPGGRSEFFYPQTEARPNASIRPSQIDRIPEQLSAADILPVTEAERLAATPGAAGIARIRERQAARRAAISPELERELAALESADLSGRAPTQIASAPASGPAAQALSGGGSLSPVERELAALEANDVAAAIPPPNLPPIPAQGPSRLEELMGRRRLQKRMGRNAAEAEALFPQGPRNAEEMAMYEQIASGGGAIKRGSLRNALLNAQHIKQAAYEQTLRQFGLEKVAFLGAIQKAWQGMGALRRGTTIAGAGIGALGGMMSAGPNAGFGETAARTIGGGVLGGAGGFGVGTAMRGAGVGAKTMASKGLAPGAMRGTVAPPRLGTNTMGRAATGAAAPAAGQTAAGATGQAAAGATGQAAGQAATGAAQPGFFARNWKPLAYGTGIAGIAGTGYAMS